jgi:hypothetical protein
MRVQATMLLVALAAAAEGGAQAADSLINANGLLKKGARVRVWSSSVNMKAKEGMIAERRDDSIDVQVYMREPGQSSVRLSTVMLEFALVDSLEVSVPTTRPPVSVARRTTKSGRTGVMIGMAVGAVVGLAAGYDVGEGPLLGVIGALAGGTFGGLVGVTTGLATGTAANADRDDWVAVRVPRRTP